jgi:TonB family protein
MRESLLSGALVFALSSITPLANAVPADQPRYQSPRVKNRIRPGYPERAARAGLNGIVVVQCEIEADGQVRSVRPVKGYSILMEAALDAVRKWKYSPGTVDGVRTFVSLEETLNFKLEKPPSRSDLIESLRDSDADVRWSAATWLGRYRPAIGEQLHALGIAAKDPDVGVADAAKASLASLSPKR